MYLGVCLASFKLGVCLPMFPKWAFAYQYFQNGRLPTDIQIGVCLQSSIQLHMAYGLVVASCDGHVRADVSMALDIVSSRLLHAPWDWRYVIEFVPALFPGIWYFTALPVVCWILGDDIGFFDPLSYYSCCLPSDSLILWRYHRIL